MRLPIRWDFTFSLAVRARWNGSLELRRIGDLLPPGLTAAEEVRAGRHPDDGAFATSDWAPEVPLLAAEVARLRDQFESLFELAYDDNSERGPIFPLPLDRALRIRDDAAMIGGPLGAECEGLIPARPEPLADELVHIELQAVFKAYSLSWSSTSGYVLLLGRFALAALSQLAPAFPCSQTDVLCHAATLSADEALQAAMLLPESEALPNLGATTFDEVLAVRVVVNHELDGLLVCRCRDRAASTRREIAVLDLKELLARAVFHRQMEEQMAVHDIRLPARLALTRPCPSEHDAAPMQPLVQALTELSRRACRRDRLRRQ